MANRNGGEPRSTSLAMTVTIAKSLCAAARSRYPLADHVVDALCRDGLSRDDALSVAEAAGADTGPAREQEARRAARAAEDAAKWSRFWGSFEDHHADGAPVPEPPHVSCPRRPDPAEGMHGIGGRSVRESKTVVTYADVPSCAGGHANQAGARFCAACGDPLASEAERREQEERYLAAERRNAEGSAG